MSARATATDRAYSAIREGIASGQYPPGISLREEEIADTLGVSRTPVREALRRLDAEGLAELLPHRGARVAIWTDHDLDEIFQLRVQLEGHGARLAATRATDEMLDKLQGLADEIELEVRGQSPERFERITDLNNQFHRTIISVGENRRLSNIIGTIVQRGLVSRTFQLYTPEQLDRSCRHHRELIEACRVGDPDWAEAVMIAHLFHGRYAARGAVT
jgi:DNA-binding GntR family transcriptional regulator